MSAPALVDRELERACAAEAVFDPGRYNARGLAIEDYASDDCRVVVGAAREAWELGDAGLEGTVRALQRSRQIDRVGGSQGLMAMLSSGGAPDGDRLRRLARLRAIQDACADAIRVAGQEDLPGALDKLQGAIAVGMSGAAVKVKSAPQVVEGLLEGIRDASAYDKRVVHPGVQAIEDAIGCLPIGSLTVVAADSGVGKSSLSLEMVILASQRNVTCGYISLEDPEDVTGSRLLGAMSGISSSQIQRGQIGDRMGELATGVAKIKQIGDRLLFADCTGENDIDVRAAMSQMAGRGARMVVVDYLTEIGCSSKQQDRRNEIRWIAKQLKAHAKRLGMALVLVSQIARPENRNPNAKPTKHSIKEAGDVTNMAEVILIMWRESESDDALVSVEIAKCKWGGLGRWWRMKRTRDGRLVEAES